MTDTPSEDTPRPRPRPTPRPRPGGARPSPRPRVAGSRRSEDEIDPTPTTPDPTQAPVTRPTSDPVDPPQTAGEGPRRRPRPGPRPTTSAAAPLPKVKPRPGPTPTASGAGRTGPSRTGAAKAGPGRTGAGKAGPGSGSTPSRRGRVPALVLVLAVLCVLTAAGGGWLLWQRANPATVDPDIFAAARAGVEDVYAYDYQDSEGSVQRKLDALTGDLRDQYEADLSQGGIIDTYEQVSATTSYDVLEVGLQQVDESQDQATLVVFGQYVVTSVNSGTQEAPAGSECTVTDDGAQSCTQTVRVTVTDVDGEWKISELTLLTTS